MKKRSRKRKGGFTLLEVLLVLAILVILGGMVAVNIANVRERAFSDVAKRQIETFESMLEMYRMDTGRYPSTATGLNGLREAPADLPNPKKWKGPYADEDIPLDPWDNQYKYEQLTPTEFTIRSLGPDMIDNTGDDING